MSIARRILPTLAALVAVPTIASAQLTGSSVGLNYYWPTLASPVENHGPAVVGGGIEFLGVTGNFNVDVGSSSVFVQYLTGNSWCGPTNPACPQASTTFNGFRLFDVGSSAPAFTSVTINAATNMVGFDASRVTFDADNIYVDWKDLAFDEHTRVVLDINTSTTTTPEPASLALFGTGIVAIGGVVARRRRKA